MPREVYEIKDVACGNCQVCILGNSSLSRQFSKHFPDWRPGRITQISMTGGIGQNIVHIECCYSPTRRVCRKEVVVDGEEEDPLLRRIITLLDELAGTKKGRGGSRE